MYGTTFISNLLSPGEHAMNRRREDFQDIDTSAWPTVDFRALNGEQKSAFAQYKKSVELFVSGITVREIENLTRVNRRQLYRLLDRCMTQAPDGQVFGFRALLKHHRFVPYSRTAKLSAACSITHQGFVGAFALLLEQHPALVDWLQQKIRKHAVVLDQISTDGILKTRLRGLGNLHAGFIMQCRAVGITAADYPFNTDRIGIRALSEYVTAEMLRNFGSAAHAAGAKRLKGFPKLADCNTTAAVFPYQVVEFDGHRLDVRLKIIVRDPLGFEQEFEIERIWLLVIIDVCTRAVLGYHLVLTREYNRYDVIKTIEKALAPHRSRSFTLPNVGYGTGGFPSGKLPELGYAIWHRMRLDNAKANLAGETMIALCEFIGCAADAGPPHHPDDRPYIERFFGTMCSNLSSRLPGYTGSSPQDLRRALADPKGNLRLFVSLTELEELMEASIALYNATPHSGVNGRTPLEAMEYLVRGKGTMITWLPESKRRTLCLMQTAHRCRVRGYLAQGTRPHINLFGVRYTSPVLAASGALLGQNLRVYYNSDDVRTVRTFLADGSELGVLKAQGAWGEICHDLKLRREIMKLRGNKRLAFTISQEFIDRFVEAKKIKAKKSRRAASDLERTLRVLANAPTSNTPPGPAKSSDDKSKSGEPAAVQSVDQTRTDKPKIEPQKLTIGFGYASGGL
jgi:putative transposase